MFRNSEPGTSRSLFHGPSSPLLSDLEGLSSVAEDIGPISFGGIKTDPDLTSSSPHISSVAGDGVVELLTDFNPGDFYFDESEFFTGPLFSKTDIEKEFPEVKNELLNMDDGAPKFLDQLPNSAEVDLANIKCELGDSDFEIDHEHDYALNLRTKGFNYLDGIEEDEKEKDEEEEMDDSSEDSDYVPETAKPKSSVRNIPKPKAPKRKAVNKPSTSASAQPRFNSDNETTPPESGTTKTTGGFQNFLNARKTEAQRTQKKIFQQTIQRLMNERVDMKDIAAEIFKAIQDLVRHFLA